MRNLEEYPITTEEIVQCLQYLIDEHNSGVGFQACGAMEPLLLAKAKEIILEREAELAEHLEFCNNVDARSRKIQKLTLEVQAIITEWQEARKAAAAYPHKKDPNDEQKAVWSRLADAEHALMKL